MVAASMIPMFGFKVKFVFFCMTAFLILSNWSQAAEYDEDFDSEGNFDDLENEDAQISQARFVVGRQGGTRRRFIDVDRRPGSGRRRWVWR